MAGEEDSRMAPRRRLQIAILEAETTQREIADLIDMGERKFSDIVLGRRRPSEAERAAIAKALGRPVDDLFERMDLDEDAAPRCQTPWSPEEA